MKKFHVSGNWWEPFGTWLPRPHILPTEPKCLFCGMIHEEAMRPCTIVQCVYCVGNRPKGHNIDHPRLLPGTMTSLDKVPWQGVTQPTLQRSFRTLTVANWQARTP